jgi:hypothetical protein
MKKRTQNSNFVCSLIHETSSLTLNEEHRLWVSKNKVLRRIFGPKRDEVIGGWRKWHNENLHNLYLSANIIRINKSRKRRGVHTGF